MSTLKIPVSICNDLDAAVRKFWWIGDSNKNRFQSFGAWMDLCQAKAYRGLGFRRFADFNRALLAKLA